MDDALVKLKEALTINHLPSFLMGEHGYDFVDPWAETPTDLTTVFIRGFNQYIGNSGENKRNLEIQLQQALGMLLTTAEGTWWVVSILYSYLLGYKENILKFEIDIEALVEPVNKSLQSFAEELRGNKKWVGWRFEGGLLENVKFMVGRINEKLRSKGIREIIL